MVRRLLDWCVLRLSRGVREQEFKERRGAVEDVKHILYEMDVLDSKSAALLTHVSVMIAVVALMLSSEDSRNWRFAMGFELAAFSAVGVLLLRCVDVMGPPFRLPPDDPQANSQTYRNEIAVRRGIYQAMVRTVSCLTILLIVSVIWKTVGDRPL